MDKDADRTHTEVISMKVSRGELAAIRGVIKRLEMSIGDLVRTMLLAEAGHEESADALNEAHIAALSKPRPGFPYRGPTPEPLSKPRRQ